MKFYFLSFLLYLPLCTWAQNGLGEIRMIPTLNGEALEIGRTYFLESLDDSIRVETLKFYVGHMQFFQDKQKIGELERKYFLVDAEKPASLSIALPAELTGSFNKLKFHLGVDSISSVSGAFGGDLDPMHGMYWTWQSGYINLKFEGTAQKSPARNHVFQFHVGGYKSPFKAEQEVELNVSDKQEINVHIALDKFLLQVDLKENHHIMSPNLKAVKAAQRFASSISISL